MPGEMLTGPIDLTGRQPAWPAWLTRAWLRAVESAAWSCRFWITPRSRGDPRLLEVLAAELGVTEANLVVTPGVRFSVPALAQQARVSFVEQPTFAEIPRLLSLASREVVMGGWDALSDYVCRDGAGPDLIWVTSPGRNPDGASLGCRECAVLDRLAAQGSKLIVNEVYRWYGEAMAPREAIRIGSLSKLVGGGARLGWVIGADDDVTTLSRAGPPTLWQRAWAHMLGDIGFGRLREIFVMPAIEAKAAFCEEMSGYARIASDAGPSVLLELSGLSEDMAVDILRRDEILVGRGSDFLAASPAVRLCFSDVSPSAARLAARRIMDLAGSGP
jgi:DNA-binding transcriptional MocR family regulator